MLDPVDENIYQNDELKHWGIIGMKWGIRRYQNPDGTLTPEGRERYGVKTVAETKKLSYSQKYESLKNKKNRTPKEQKQLEDLEKGREYLIQMHGKPVKGFSKEKFEQGKLATEFMMSTNFGKEQARAQFLLGPFASISVGLANENDFLKELKENVSSEDNDSQQNGRKFLGNDQYVMTTKDIRDDFENDVLKLMNLDRRKGEEYQDIVIDSDGYIRRKDGKDFEYYIDGKKIHASFFDEIPLDYDYAMNNHKWFDPYPPTKEDKSFINNINESLDKGIDGINLESFKLARPVKDVDLDVNVKNVMKIFGLSKEDLVIDKRNNVSPKIYLKNGQALKYKDVYGDNKIIKQMNIQFFADEGDWPGGSIIPLNEQSPKIDKSDISRMRSLRNSGYTLSEISRKVGIPVGSIEYYLDED